MIDDETRMFVIRDLSYLEDTRHVNILYACESGSRAWGFESRDSDYDIRFIYTHDPLWYLSIQENRKDTLEFENGNLDYAGWELRKTLRLFRKSNPNLYEWLTSPYVYLKYGPLHTRMSTLIPNYFSPKRAMYHYFHMANGNFRDYLRGDDVWVKKYFYVLRPVLACLHIEKGMGMPPVQFNELVSRTVDDKDLFKQIGVLVRLKRDGAELKRGPRIPVISEFIEHHLERMFRVRNEWELDDAKYSELDRLDELFFYTLCELYDYNWCEEWAGDWKHELE